MKLNGHNNEYIVLFDGDRYHPDLHYRACKHRYDSIKGARAYANKFRNAYIFKLHYPKDCDFPDIYEVI